MAARRPLVGLILFALSAVVLAVPAATPADTTGLVLAFGFEETSGSTAVDSSGSGNTGTLSGPSSSASGRFGRALSFDSVNDLVNVADSSSLGLTSAMTLEAWVKPEATDWRTVVLKERPGGLAYALYSSTDTGRPSGEVRTTTTAETRGTANLPTGSWSHLATTYDGTTLRLYVNGIQVSSRALSGSIAVTTGALRIGGNTIWGEYFKGLVDEVRIYRRALSAAELQADMATGIATADTQPPSAPGSLTATVINGDDARLTWTASTDNVGVTGYRVYRSTSAGFTPGPGTLIAARGPTQTTIDDNNLPAGTFYYKVDAVDAAGNVSAPSGEAAATPVDTEPPSAPGNLTATLVEGNKVQLAWEPSVDAGGDIDQYYVYRSTAPNFAIPASCCGIAILPASERSYVDQINEPGGATYYYKVVSRDQTNHQSAPSNEVSATIGPDTTPPTVSVDAPCDGVAPVSEYFYVYLNLVEDRKVVDVRVDVDGILIWQVDDVNWNTFRFEFATRDRFDRFPNGLHVMTAVVRDAAGNETVSAPCLWNVQNPVFTVPFTSPADGATVSGIVTLKAEPRVDGLPTTWNLYPSIAVDGVVIDTPSFPSWEKSWDTTTWSNGVHTVTAKIYFNDYGFPVATSTIQVTVNNTVTLPRPTGVTAVTRNGDDVHLSWNAAPAGSGVTGFQVHRFTSSPFNPSDATRIATVATPGYVDLDVTPGTPYYRVVAVDSSGNTSPPSDLAYDTVLPPPSGVSATVTEDDVRIVWNAAPSGSGVARYWIHRSTAAGFAPTFANLIASVTGTVYDDLDRPAGIYYYLVVATDGLDPGPPSDEVSATVLTPPAVPVGLVAAYGFEESSATTVADSSGHGNNGTISGALHADSGKFGRSLSLQTANNLVTIPDSDSLDLTSGMTLEAWVSPSVVVNSWRTVLLKERPGGLAYALYAATDSRLPGGFIQTGAEFSALAPSQIGLVTWTHLAATYDGTSLRFYVNGALVSTTAATGALQTSGGPLQIGGNSVWSEWFIGKIDELRIYNRALTAAEIVADRDRPVVPGT